jgi:hypothetical protein
MTRPLPGTVLIPARCQLSGPPVLPVRYPRSLRTRGGPFHESPGDGRLVKSQATGPPSWRSILRRSRRSPPDLRADRKRGLGNPDIGYVARSGRFKPVGRVQNCHYRKCSRTSARGDRNQPADNDEFCKPAWRPDRCRAILNQGRCAGHPCRNTRRVRHTEAYRPGSRAEPRKVETGLAPGLHSA